MSCFAVSSRGRFISWSHPIGSWCFTGVTEEGKSCWDRTPTPVLTSTASTVQIHVKCMFFFPHVFVVNPHCISIFCRSLLFAKERPHGDSFILLAWPQEGSRVVFFLFFFLAMQRKRMQPISFGFIKHSSWTPDDPGLVRQ